MAIEPWFGLAAEKSTYLLSAISIYDHVLNKKEIVDLPILYKEYDGFNKLEIERSFRTFFYEHFSKSLKLSFHEHNFSVSDKFNIEDDLIDFLHERRLGNYVDRDSNIIYYLSFDLNILIYHKNFVDFSLPSNLHLLGINKEIYWEETPWF